MSTATPTTVLLKKGLRNIWMRGIKEAWIMEEVARGAALLGLYPMNAETKARYDAFRKHNATAGLS